MSKIQRKSAKIFAENASAAIGGVAQFGSLAAGTPTYSKDPDVIQSLQQYADGWTAAVLGTKSPALEDRNAIDYLLSYQQAYILQQGVPEWLDTETYYENSYVVDSNGALRVSLIDNNTGNDPIEDEGGQYWGYAGSSGSGKAIGEVYYSQSNLATDNKGGLPLFTGETISNADQLYPQFYAWVNSHNDLQISAADYETALTTYGECPKYVIDTVNKTIRLPLLKNYVKMANTTDGITQEDAGLPNITGKISANPNGYNEGAFDGPVTNAPNQAGSGATNWKIYTFDASLSSSVYGNSNTVTPAHTTLYPWVCAYNGAVPASTAQAAEFQQALSSKVDLASGVSQNDVDYVVESYQSGTSWYRLYKSGWCEQGGATSSGDWTQITLLKPYTDTNYTVIAGSTDSDMDGNLCSCAINSKSATGFYIGNYFGGTAYSYSMWYACGYIS